MCMSVWRNISPHYAQIQHSWASQYFRLLYVTTCSQPATPPPCFLPSTHSGTLTSTLNACMLTQLQWCHWLSFSLPRFLHLPPLSQSHYHAYKFGCSLSRQSGSAYLFSLPASRLGCLLSYSPTPPPSTSARMQQTTGQMWAIKNALERKTTSKKTTKCFFFLRKDNNKLFLIQLAFTTH